jgi:hypothetical protein
MHCFLAVYYITLPLLHVSAPVCHHQGALLYPLSYMRIWVNGWQNSVQYVVMVCYVEAWCVSICQRCQARSIRNRPPHNRP